MHILSHIHMYPETNKAEDKLFLHIYNHLGNFCSVNDLKKQTINKSFKSVKLVQMCSRLHFQINMTTRLQHNEKNASYDYVLDVHFSQYHFLHQCVVLYC